MKTDGRAVPDLDGVGRAAKGTSEAMAIELATGLSLADVDVLRSNPSPETRADIAVKFAREFDRLAKGIPNTLTSELLHIFSKDRSRLVRMRFADSLKTSPHLPGEFAARLAKDHIDVAGPILLRSPALDDGTIADIIVTMPEDHALALADRRPFGQDLADLLIEHRGTRLVVLRLLDNQEAELSDDALLGFRKWGKADPEIADRLKRRPNLPFFFVNQSVIELTESVQWRSLSKRTMTKFEAAQLNERFEGRKLFRRTSTSERFRQFQKALKDDYERGRLDPLRLLGFLHDRDIDRLECAFAVMTGLDLQRVRSLLHGSDRRGLIALCLRADFATADYLAFRMALGLADIGKVREQQEQRYSERTMKFACEQFEKMRADPHQLRRWLPPEER